MSMLLNVLIIDAHRTFAEALATALQGHDDLHCVGTVNSVDDVAEVIDRHHVDVAVLATDATGDQSTSEFSRVSGIESCAAW